MNELTKAIQHDLTATINALEIGEAVGRRNFEAFREWAKLERDWLNGDELEHLKRATILGRKQSKSLVQCLERTKNADDAKPTSSEPAEDSSLSEMARELRALRAVSEASRRNQDALTARLKTEDSYYAAWETRLRYAEEEQNALWDVIEELIRLSSASAPRLEKLERRVGYQFLRQKHSKEAQGKRLRKPSQSA
jgi:hypothetical protein